MSRNSEYNRQKHYDLTIKYKNLRSLLPECTHDFLEDKRRTCQINTVIAYTYDLASFFEYIVATNPTIQRAQDITVETLDLLTYKDINEYQDYMESSNITKERNNSVSSINRRMSAVNGLFSYLNKTGELQNNPTILASQRIKQKEKYITRLDTTEVSALMDVVSHSQIGTDRQKKILRHSRFRDTAIFSLILGTGIRVSECVALDIDDLDMKEMSILVTRKGGKEQKIYFNESVSLAIGDYLEFERCSSAQNDEKALFLSNRKTRISVRTVQALVEKYTSTIPNKKISVHKLRSTYGSALYKETGDIKLVADVLGHSDINTAHKYYAAQEEANRKRAGKINPYD